MTRPLHNPFTYRKKTTAQHSIMTAGFAFLELCKKAYTDHRTALLLFKKAIIALLFVVMLSHIGYAQTLTYSLNPGSHVNPGNGTYGPTNGWTTITAGESNPPYVGDENVNGIHLYSSGGAGTVVAFNKFTENGSGGTARTLLPGDRILIKFQTNTAPNSGTNYPGSGQANASIGISFNNNTTFSSVASRTTNQVCKFELGASNVNSGDWSVFSGAGLATVNTNTLATPNATGNAFGNAGTAYWVELDVTSSNTFDATIYSSYTGSGTGGTYKKYCNLSFGSAGPISSFCIYDVGVASGNNPDIWVEQISQSGIDQTAGTAQPDVSAITLENIQGAGSAAGAITGNITDGSNANTTTTSATTLTMGGTGTVTLSGTNSYTGLTTIKSGVLQLGAANQIPANGLTLSGGTLSSGATTGFGNTSMGALSMTASSAISLGTGAHTLTFGSLGGTWTGTLTVNGWTGTVSASGTAGKIFIGASATLTAGQLSQFSFTGYSGATQLASGEVVPTAVVTPTVVLANNSGGQVATGNIQQNSTSNIIYNFQTAVTVTTATLNAVAFTTTGTATSGTDITNFKLWYTSGSTFTSPTLLSTLTTSLGAGTHNFTGLTQAVASGSTGYFWITADIPSGATVNNTIIGSALTTGNLTYSVSPSISGTPSSGGTQTIIVPVPVIVLANNSGGQVGAGNIQQNSTSDIIYNFQTAVTNTTATLNAVAFSTTGTATSGTDITNLKLWYNSSNTFGTATLLSTLTTGLGSGTHNFTGLTQAVSSGATGYFWITADIPSGATINNTIIGSALTTGNLTYSVSPSISGTPSAGGTQTIIAPVPVIVLANNSGGQVSAANIIINTTSNIIYNFQTAVTNTTATLNAVAFTTTGTATSGTDITNFKLWYNSSNTFGTATLLSTLTTSLGAGTHNFTSLTQSVSSGATGYFWITADIPSGATINNTIIGSALTTGNLTYSVTPSISGTPSAGGTQTIKNLYFRSLATGTWSTPGNWQSSPDNSTWSTATVYPQAGANTVTIQSPHTITMDVSPGNLANNVTVNSGGRLFLNNGTTLAISAGTLTINGTLNVQTGAVVSGAGTFTLTSSTSDTLYIGDANGITTSGATGSIQTTTRNYGANAVYGYDGTVNQVIGNGLPSPVGALIINNTGSSGNNVVSLSANTTIQANPSTGILTLTAGILKPGSFTLTFNNNSSTNGIVNNGGDLASTGTNGLDGGTVIIGNGSGAAFNFTGTGTTTFYNLTVGSGVGSANRTIVQSASSGVLINGTLTLQDNNFAWQTNSPKYSTSATLYVNDNGQAYTPGGASRMEWAATSGYVIGTTAGYPNNVQLVNVSTASISQSLGINGTLILGNGTTAGNATISGGTSGAFFCGGVTINANSTLTAPAANMTVKGNWLRTGAAATFTNSSGTVSFGGSATCSSPYTISSITSGSETFYNLAVTNGTYVSLSSPVTVTNIFTLTSGVITTTSTNILSITNTATSGISGGSSTSFVNGPLKWALLSSGTNSYIFPVGAVTCPATKTYLPFTLSSKNTTASNTATVQAFAVGSGGSVDGTTISFLDSAVYWSLTTSAGLGTTGSSVSLNQQTAISPYNVVAQSTTLTGTYSSLAGTASTNGVSGSNDIGTASPWYFGFGEKYVAGTITTGTVSGSPFCQSASVSVPFTFTGATLTSFTAQLSDASGSFASPVTIGTGTSSPISATLPSSAANGAGYRIRVISVSPDVTGTDNGTNLTISGQAITLSSGSSSTTVCPSSTITSIVYTLGGTATSAGISWSPSTPTGISYSGTTISGTPTTQGAYTYTLTTAGTSCVAATATGTLIVGQGALLTSAAGTNNQTVCQNTAITNITYNVGSATGATTAGLPTGVTGAYSSGVYTISGTPSVSGTYNYTVTTSGACGSATTATGSIIVNGAPLIYSYPSGPSLLYLYNGAGGNLANTGVDNWGTANNSGATQAADRFGNSNSSYSFNGSTNYMYNGTFLVPNYNTFSEGIWFKTSTAGGVMMGLSNNQNATSSTSYDHTLYMDNSGNVYFGTYQCCGTNHPLAGSSGTNYADGVWHLAVGTINTDGEALYVDGVLKGTNVFNSPSSGGEGYVVIGANNLALWTPAPTDNYFTGLLDDPIIYDNTELTLNQAFNMYSTGYASITSTSCSGATVTVQSFTLATGTYNVTYNVSGTNTVSSSTSTMTFTAGSPGSGTFITSALPNAGSNNVVNITMMTGSNGCSTSISLPTPPFTTSGGSGYTWTGAVDSNWSVAGNWSCAVPTSTSDVIIPYVGPSHKEPIIPTDITIHSINLSSSSSTVGINGHTFTINGIASGTGTYTGSSSSNMSFGGSSTGTVYFTSGSTNNTLHNLTLSDGANISLGSALNIASTGTVTVGTTTGATLATGGFMTLVSDNSGWARVAAVPVSGGLSLSTISGNVAVQSYFHSTNSAVSTSRRAWQLLTAPITNNGLATPTTIYTSWQNGGVFASGIGTMVTAPPYVATGGSGNGMDYGINSNYSAYTWNVSTQSLVHISNSKVNISGTSASAANIGYFIFMRGDRTPSTVAPPWIATINNTTISASGPLQLGDQAFTSASGALSATANGLSLVGNPYACSIDFSELAGDKVSYTTSYLNNVINRIYVWDADLTGSQNLGGYVCIDDPNNINGYYTKSLGATGLASTADLSIQSGQAFFVQTQNTASASITFKELMKNTTNNFIYRPADETAASTTQSFIATLSLLNADSSASLTDGIVAQFNNAYCDCVDYIDAPKFNNVDEMFSLTRAGKQLCIERRPEIYTNDTLFLNLKQMSQRRYRFNLYTKMKNHPGLGAHLEDSYTGIHTPLNMDGSNTVDFALDTAAASRVQNRFMVVFGSVNIVPVYTTIKATREANTVLVEWALSNEQNITGYVLQKSTDGINYVNVYTTAAQHTTGAYNWVDVNPSAGTNYYRVLSTDVLNEQSYSPVVSVNIKALDPSGISVYPNPIQSGRIGIAMNNMPAGEYHYRLLDDLGQEIQTGSIVHPGGNATNSIQINKAIAKGTYRLEIFQPDNTKTIISILN